MKTLGNLRNALEKATRRLFARVKYRDFERDLAQELDAHRAMAEAELRERGLSPDEARTTAARSLGNVTYMREEARAVWIARWVESVWQDVRYAGRQFRRQPGFAVTSVLTLGIALGLLTSVFAIYSALYLRAWDVPDPDSVFVVRGTEPPAGTPRAFTPAAFERLQHVMSSADIAAIRENTFRLDNGPDVQPTELAAGWVSDRFVDTLRLPLRLGTGFSNAGTHPSAIISYALWQSRFAGRLDVIGQPLPLTSRSTTITTTVVGVLPRGFTGLAPMRVDTLVNLASRDLWKPGWSAPARDTRLELVGRVRSGYTREQAMAELAAVGPAALTSEELTIATAFGLDTTFGTWESLRGTVPLLFLLLFLATGLIVALACANVGNLHLARGVRRQRELAIRLSLGAGRTRVVRQLLTESLILALTAALVGLAVAAMLPGAILQLDTKSALYALTPDYRTYTFMTAAAILACALFAIAPSLRFSRSARLTATAPAGAGRLRSIILGVQVATSITLVTAATLLTRGVALTAASDGGFALHEVMVGSILKPAGAYSADRNAALLAHLRQHFAVHPHLTIGVTEHPPLSNRSGALYTSTYGRLEGLTMDAVAFEALGIPLVAGRVFSDNPSDAELVINQAMASRLWPGQQALGRMLDNRVVVGVADNARLVNVTQTSALFFRPLERPSTFFVTFRSSAEAEQVFRQAIADFDPRLEVRIAPVASDVRRQLRSSLIGASVAGGLAVLALLLSIVGVFGVAAFIVEERQREIGVRLALGARRLDIRRALVAAARWPLVSGVAGGLLLSVLGGFLLRAFLLDVSPVDPVSYAIVSLLIFGASAIATWIPMRRALGVDPAVTLRAE